MKLTVLGCAGTFPGPDSGCSSYLIEHEGFRLMVDCGYGAIGALQRHGSLLNLDAVIVTHLHADHCIDLVGYAYARYYDPGGAPAPLPVWGPAGTSDRIATAIQGGSCDWLKGVYDWRPLDAAKRDVGPFTVSGELMAHPIECYGLRIEAAGRTIAYSADTGACDQLVDLARGADLFLCEASFLETRPNPPDVHLTGKQAGEHGLRADVGTLLLTHLVPAWGDEEATIAEAAQSFDGDLRLARTGVTYPI